MGGEIFCFCMPAMTVLHLLLEIVPESDVRMAQHGLMIIYLQRFYACRRLSWFSFADITVAIDANSRTQLRLRLQECGVQVDSHQDGA